MSILWWFMEKYGYYLLSLLWFHFDMKFTWTNIDVWKEIAERLFLTFIHRRKLDISGILLEAWWQWSVSNLQTVWSRPGLWYRINQQELALPSDPCLGIWKEGPELLRGAHMKALSSLPPCHHAFISTLHSCLYSAADDRRETMLLCSTNDYCSHKYRIPRQLKSMSL